MSYLFITKHQAKHLLERICYSRSEKRLEKEQSQAHWINHLMVEGVVSLGPH